jgi:hypothetical protein
MPMVLNVKMMIKVALILTLSVAVVFASGCRKKQKDKPVGNTESPVTNLQNIPENNASPQTRAHVIEANDQNVITDIHQDQNIAESVTQKQISVAVVPEEQNVVSVAAQTETAPVSEALEEPNTNEQPPVEQFEEMTLSKPPDMKTFESFKDSAGKIRYMAAVAKAYPDSLAPFVEKALDDADIGVRAAAVDMLADKGFYSPDIVPVALKAMNDKEPTIRQKALESCSNVTDTSVSDVLVAAMDDQREDIRTAAIQMSAKKAPSIRLPVLETALTSQYPDVKAGAVTELMQTSSPEALDILIGGLDDTDLEFHYNVQTGIKHLIGQEFDTSEQAKKWWDDNRSNFGNDLKPIDPNQK